MTFLNASMFCEVMSPGNPGLINVNVGLFVSACSDARKNVFF